jgi:hypothetical protein
MIDLSSYPSIQSNLFVRIAVDEYRTTPGGSFTSEVLRFSDRLGNYTLNSEVYVGAGALMGITATSSEIRTSGGEITISLSGIPNTSIAEIINSKIKGSRVDIYRAIFDSTSGQLLSIAGNPLGRFKGYVTTFTLNEDFDNTTRTSSNTIVLNCSSIIDVLQNKISGRKTNPSSQKKFYSSDVSMDRVPNLANATFNFGAP